jgi:ADP-ribose pyrophosphatase YjhB (NUDIX family)
MKYENGLNEVQGLIMRQLFTRSALRFSEINTEDFPSDQFSYHLRQLIKTGLIEKTDDDRYQLSVIGRGRAILLDTRSSNFIEQGFVACRVVLPRMSEGAKQYLVQKRTKVPYRGYIADPGGKILFGEDIIDAAKRNMLAETGLDCEMVVKGVVHFKDSYDEQIVQDKYFFVIKATNPVGDMLTFGPTGENHWMSLEEILCSTKVHQGLSDLITIAESNDIGFSEQTHIAEDY